MGRELVIIFMGLRSFEEKKLLDAGDFCQNLFAGQEKFSMSGKNFRVKMTRLQFVFVEISFGKYNSNIIPLKELYELVHSI